MASKKPALYLAFMAILMVTSACGAKASPTAAPVNLLPADAQVPEMNKQTSPSGYLPAPTQAAAATSQNYGGANNPLQAPNDQQHYDTFFQNYGVNPRIDTQDDALSTFALDVDTGSYTIMRSYVNDGSLPPKDSVRVEEYVNYFDQGYSYPPEHQAFAINIDGAPSPFAENEHYQLLRIGIQGYAVPASQRKDVALTFVIDVSGSMDMDKRLELVKRTLELLVEELRPSDRVSLVVYGTQAHIVLEPIPGDHKEAILKAIYSLHPEGVTNAEAGLRLGYKMASRAFNPEAINRVILCSDGVANFGQTGAESIWDEVKGYASKGITLTTVGFGMDNYNDVLMEQLADNGDGFYAYVDTLKEARRIFVENLTSTLQVIAMNAKVQVDFNPEVVSRYRLVGFENRAVADEDFRNNSVDAGEVGAGHTVTALYEVRLDPEAVGRIATVYLRWEDPDTHEVMEMSRDFTASQMAHRFADASPNFQWSVAVAEYAEILRGSYWAQNLNLADVSTEAHRIGESLEEDPDVREFLELIHRAVRLSDE